MENKRTVLPAEPLYEADSLLLGEEEAWHLVKDILTEEQIEKAKAIKNVDEKEMLYKALYSLNDRLNQGQTSAKNLDKRIQGAFDRAKDKAIKMSRELVNIVVAVDSVFCIGKNGKLPWHQKSDLKHVKELTENHIIIVGNETFKSTGVLPNREIRVLTKNPPTISKYKNVHYYTNPIEALSKRKDDDREIFIFGGQSIYELYFSKVTDIYITFIDTIVEDGDSFFPEFQLDSFNTREVVDLPADKDNEFPCKIAHLRKIRGREVRFTKGRTK